MASGVSKPLIYMALATLLYACGGGSGGEAVEPAVAPQDVTATGGNQRVTVAWSSAADDATYDIYWSTTPDIDPAAAVSWDDIALDVTSPHVLDGLANAVSHHLVVTATTDGIERAVSVEVSAIPALLNDTGITQCADDVANDLDCPVSGFPGQDGETGRDAQARAGNLMKLGDGAAGFDFTRIGSDGMPLASQDGVWDDAGDESEGTRWPCVLDNLTGLMWEVKADDEGSLHHHGWTYRYAYCVAEPGRACFGFPGSDSAACGNTLGSGNDCRAEAFVDAVNSAAVCGYEDWRMPMRKELLSIVDSGSFAPAIDTGHFPHASSVVSWTFSPWPEAPGGGWGIDFDSGNAVRLTSDDYHAVRLVRTAYPDDIAPLPAEVSCVNETEDIAPTTPTAAFINHQDGTVTHAVSGLMWMRCSLGQTWTGFACSGEAEGIEWGQALNEITSINEGAPAGHGDWRLPNKNELESIVEERCWKPAVNTAVFPETSPAPYWTASPRSDEVGNAWIVDFEYGLVNRHAMAGSGEADSALPFTRLVRDP